MGRNFELVIDGFETYEEGMRSEIEVRTPPVAPISSRGRSVLNRRSISGFIYLPQLQIPYAEISEFDPDYIWQHRSPDQNLLQAFANEIKRLQVRRLFTLALSDTTPVLAEVFGFSRLSLVDESNNRPVRLTLAEVVAKLEKRAENDHGYPYFGCWVDLEQIDTSAWPEVKPLNFDNILSHSRVYGAIERHQYNLRRKR